MAYLNHCSFVGRLGADPDVRSVGPGKTTASLRLAISKRFTSKGERKEKTVWVNLVLWNQQAEFAQKYLRKGDMVLASGELDVRTWDDKNGGGKRSTTEIVVRDIQSLTRRDSSGDEPSHSDASPSDNYPPSSEDDLPF